MSDRTANRLLWTLQGLLALLFLFAGYAKLSMPPAELEAQAHMSATFLRFISVCELLGAAGLVLPGLTGILPVLTPVAAAGLIVIMIGATIVTVLTVSAPAALLPLATGALVAVAGYGRWKRLSGRSTRTTAPVVGS